MAEMPAASPAQDLGPVHEQAAVGARDDGAGEWPIEARPAGTAVEFRGRAKQRKGASRTRKRSAAMLHVERTGERPLGPRLAQDVIAVRAEQLLPFGGRMHDFKSSGRFARRWSKYEPRDPAQSDGTEQCPTVEFSIHAIPIAPVRLNQRWLGALDYPSYTFAKANPDRALALAPCREADLIAVFEEAARFPARQIDGLLAATADLEERP